MLHATIKALRTLKKISQKSMAEALYKSQSAYSRMESGMAQISSKDLVRIAEILDCNPEDLLNRKSIVNAMCHMQHRDSNTYMNYSVSVHPENESLQRLIENQNKLMEEIKAFLALQSEQMALIQEVILSLKNRNIHQTP